MTSFCCKSCKETFDDEGDLYRHLLSEIDRGVKKICPYCSARLKDKDGFKQHMCDNHRNYECPCCDKCYYSREFFERHVENKHIKQEWDEVYIHLDGMDTGETIHDFTLRLETEGDFDDTCEKIKKKTEHFMHYNTRYKNSRVVLSGSVGKDTAIDGHSDLDLVLFLGPYDVTTMVVFIGDVDDIIATLKRHIENGDLNWAAEVRLKSTSQCSIQFTVKWEHDDNPIKVDLLPAVDVLHGRYTYQAKRKIYQRMKTMSTSDRNFFNPSLTELQLHMFTNVPDGLKYVIRVVKMWAKTIRKVARCRVSSYFFELIVLHIWRKNGCKKRIAVAYSVKMVMHALCFCPSLRIVWPEEYNFMDYVPEKDGPMVLDPANPFRDLAPSMETAVVISRRAIDLINNASLTDRD